MMHPTACSLAFLPRCSRVCAANDRVATLLLSNHQHAATRRMGAIGGGRAHDYSGRRANASLEGVLALGFLNNVGAVVLLVGLALLSVATYRAALLL
jgi:hypothetical protein